MVLEQIARGPSSQARQRKDKPLKERIRVGRACDHCKKKKIRCSGSCPCQQCTRDHVACAYDAPYARGKRRKTDSSRRGSLPSPSVSGATCGSMHSRLGDGDHHQSPSPGRQGELSDGHGFQDDEVVVVVPPSVPQKNGAAAADVVVSSRASLEPGESDKQGHFVGAASGLSFLLRLQRRLRAEAGGAGETSVFTLGDPVLPPFDELGFIPPPRAEAESLLKTYFELSSPTYRFLHRPTVEEWVRQLYENGAISGDQPHSKYAVILTVFAQAVRYTGMSSNTSDANTGVLYFQAAECQLRRENESATLTSIQALLGSCFYVLSRSRLNHCWILFGTTARLILALGLHRKKARFDRDPSSKGDLIQSECGKRLFWCAYTLDKYLSVIFGRPGAFHDDDVDQDFPSLVEDNDLKADQMIVSGQNNMNIMLGPLSHHKLGRILSQTLRSLYGIRTLSRQKQLETMSTLGAEVDTWKCELPAFLNPDKVDSRLLIPIFQRQNNLLCLAQAHVDMLIYRPCLFNHHPAQISTLSDPKDSEDVNAKVQRCVAAAMTIVGVLDRMVESGQFYAASWFSHYQAFSAVVILYTYTLRNRRENPSTWLSYFQAAERCQNMIATVASLDSLAQRFFLIMEEFRLEVVKHLQHDSPSPHVISSGRLEGSQLVSFPTEALVDMDNSAWPPTTCSSDGQPLHFLDLPNCEQLDSLALDIAGVIPDFTWTDPRAPYSH